MCFCCMDSAAGTTFESAECKDGFKKLLQDCNERIPELASAGLQALYAVRDALKEKSDKTGIWDALPEEEQCRHVQTFFTFLAYIGKADDAHRHLAKMKPIIEVLERIAGLKKDTWPKSIKYWCETTWKSDVDTEGRHAHEVLDPNGNPVNRPLSKRKHKNLEYAWDNIRSAWRKERIGGYCTNVDSKGYLRNTDLWGITTNFRITASESNPITEETLRQEMQQPEERARITICPRWYNKYQGQRLFTDPEFVKSILPDTPFKDVVDNAMRTVFHEHLHCVLFHAVVDDSLNHFDDIFGADSYGVNNAIRIAGRRLKHKKKDKYLSAMDGYSNLENVMYWCMAMYLDRWDWSSGEARRKDPTPGWTRGEGEVVEKPYKDEDKRPHYGGKA